MMPFALPKPTSESERVFSWLIVGVFSAWGGIVRYLIDQKASEKKFLWADFFTQVVISGFTGFLCGIYVYEKGYSELMILAFSGMGGVLGGHLLDVFWKRIASYLEKKNNSKK